MGRKGLITLAMLAGALIGAYSLWSNSPQAPAPVELGKLLPQLAPANIAKLTIAHPREGQVGLVPGEDGWQVADKGYGADNTQVANLIQTLTQLSKVEARTANPELHARLGLATEGAVESQAVALTIHPKEGEPIALLIGKASKGEGQLVRFAEQNQTWWVSPALSVSGNAHQWLDRRLTDIAFSEIHSVSVRFADGGALDVSRSQDTPNMSVKQLGENSKLAYESAANGMANVFGNWQFADAKPVAELGVDQPALSFVLTTFDKASLQGALYREGDDYWLVLDSAQGFETKVMAQPDWAYLLEPSAPPMLGQTLRTLIGQ